MSIHYINKSNELTYLNLSFFNPQKLPNKFPVFIKISMESSYSSTIDVSSNQRSVHCNIAPSMSFEFNRPYFLVVCTKVLLINIFFFSTNTIIFSHFVT